VLWARVERKGILCKSQPPTVLWVMWAIVWSMFSGPFDPQKSEDSCGFAGFVVHVDYAVYKL